MARKSRSSSTVLVVDDEAAIRESLKMILEYEGYSVTEAKHGMGALSQVRESAPDVVMLDIKMPEMDGLEVLRNLRERGHDMPVIIVTGHGDVSTAMEATRMGAFDFLEKPLQRDRVLVSLRNAIDNYRLERENRSLRHAPDDLVGSSTRMETLRQTIARAAPSDATVLITGESGTGKELVASAVHRASGRANRELVQVNCAAIPEELIESELFGHEKGSFTGAVRKQIGKFVAADGGTIFLDEIGDMSSRTQAKVLRVLQNGEVEPVGAQKTVRVDVRVIAATNRKLEEEIRDGNFREDLFYRLNVIPIETIALRDHLEDLPELVEYFVERYRAHRPEAPTLTDSAVDELKRLPWKGNVRELKNTVERLLVLAPGDEVDTDDVRSIVGEAGGEVEGGFVNARTLKELREITERAFIQRKLEENGWNVTQTAKSIDTPRSNLYKKMQQYAIHREGAEPSPSSPDADADTAASEDDE